MPNVLTNVQDFRFISKGGSTLDLSGYLLSWTDRIGIRLANHEYLKRDGGEVEPMGASQGHWDFQCCFLGADVTQRWNNLVATIRREPRGKMVHPRLGSINVGCAGADAQENPEAAIDVLNFTIRFVEDAVDTAVVSDSDVGPQQRAGQVTAAIAKATAAVSAVVSNRIANLVYAAAVAAQADYAAWAGKLRDNALLTAQSRLPDPSLGKLLANVEEKRDAALVALNATLARTLESSVSLTDARTAMYLTYAACAQLYAAVLAQLPPVVPFIVPTAMSKNQILVRIYGNQARAQSDGFDRLNRLKTPYWVPAGTVLQVVAPPVFQ